MKKLFSIVIVFMVMALYAQDMQTIKLEYGEDNDVKVQIKDDTLKDEFVVKQTPKNSKKLSPKEDKDRDNILDSKDKCPNTPDGVCVDGSGCTTKIKKIVHFQTDSYIVDKKSSKELDIILDIAKECFGYKILLVGYTDSTASEKYNEDLSKQRALSLKTTLLNFGISEDRIKIKYMGERNPIASNCTEEGRYKNRRVEIIFY